MNTSKSKNEENYRQISLDVWWTDALLQITMMSILEKDIFIPAKFFLSKLKTGWPKSHNSTFNLFIYLLPF